MQRFMILVAFAACSVMGQGCTEQGIEIGPVNITLLMSEGSLVTGSFTKSALSNPKLTVQITEFACDFPTEEDINSVFKQQVEGIDLSEFIRISGLDLSNMQMQAQTGDFSFMTSIRVTFFPAPVLGVPQDPVVLGEASKPGGFTDIVQLVPPEPVDLLALIRQNDSEDTGGCPRIRYEITFQVPPTQDVPFELYTTLNVYALLSQAS